MKVFHKITIWTWQCQYIPKEMGGIHSLLEFCPNKGGQGGKFYQKFPEISKVFKEMYVGNTVAPVLYNTGWVGGADNMA